MALPGCQPANQARGGQKTSHTRSSVTLDCSPVSFLAARTNSGKVVSKHAGRTHSMLRQQGGSGCSHAAIKRPRSSDRGRVQGRRLGR